MGKTVDATFDGEVFRPDEPLILASNTKVKVIIDEEETKTPMRVENLKKNSGESFAFLKMARSLKLRGPSDFSENLDDYLYGGKRFPDGE